MDHLSTSPPSSSAENASERALEERALEEGRLTTSLAPVTALRGQKERYQICHGLDRSVRESRTREHLQVHSPL